MNQSWYHSLFILLLCVGSLSAQTSDELKQKQKKYKDEISYIGKLLQQIKEGEAKGKKHAIITS